MAAAERRLQAQDTYIAWLEKRATKAEDRLAKVQAEMKCFGEIPLTRYGEALGPSGYLFKLERPEGPQTLATTALDMTYPNDPVGAWVLANACNKERLGSDAAWFVQRGNEKLQAVPRELLVQGFVGQEDREDRPSLSYTPLFAHEPR
jgi:hypothetical protein